MEKKILYFTLILVIILSTTACGNTSKEEETSTSVAETEDNTESEAATDETETETSDTDNVSIEESEPLYENEYVNTITEWADDDGNTNYWIYLSSDFDWNGKTVDEQGQLAQECVEICLKMVEESGHSLDSITIKGCLETEDTAFIYDTDTRNISLWIDNTATEEWEWQE
jgi:hypothetical protein